MVPDPRSILEGWASGKVQRMHALPIISPQCLAEHQWGVAYLIMAIWPEAPSRFLMAALTHDMGEYKAGDIPAPVLWNNPELVKAVEQLEASFRSSVLPKDYYAELNDTEKKLLEVFDRLEFCLTCLREKQKGNSLLERPADRSRGRLLGLLDDLVQSQPELEELISRIDQFRVEILD